MRRLAILLTAGALAAGASPADASEGPEGQAPPQRPGWVIVPATRSAPGGAAVSLARDLGVTPEQAQELIDAAYR